MAKKVFKISQQRKFNSDVTYASANYECDDTEIAQIVEKLDGIITVFEENTALSSPEGASDLITGGLVIDSVAMVHSEAKTKSFGAYNKPLVFKSTVSVTELQAMFKLHKPFTGAYEAQHPDKVYPRIGNIGNL